MRVLLLSLGAIGGSRLRHGHINGYGMATSRHASCHGVTAEHPGRCAARNSYNAHQDLNCFTGPALTYDVLSTPLLAGKEEGRTREARILLGWNPNLPSIVSRVVPPAYTLVRPCAYAFISLWLRVREHFSSSML